jgi:hypothetical protein
MKVIKSNYIHNSSMVGQETAPLQIAALLGTRLPDPNALLRILNKYGTSLNHDPNPHFCPRCAGA